MLALVPDGPGIRLDIQDVTGLDDQAPASPDGTSTHQSSVLGEGELLGGTGEVGDTGDDEAPLFEMSATVIDKHSQNVNDMSYCPEP